MDPSETRRLGRTDVHLTQLGFGGAPLGELFTPVTDEAASQTLRAAWAAGARYFDTAPLYGNGLSEHRIGAFLRSVERGSCVLSTKVGRILHKPRAGRPTRDAGWVGGLPFGYSFDYSYDGIMRSYEDSIQRLGLEAIDLLIVHDLDLRNHLPERQASYFRQLGSSGWRALEELRRMGEIRAIGAGINELGLIRRFLDLAEIDFFLVAMRYTLLEQVILETEFSMCVERGVGVVVGAVYNSGILATGAKPGAMYNYAPATHEILKRVARIDQVCRAFDVPLAAVALQFPLGHPAVASVIPGAVSPEQIEASVRYLRTPIPDELWKALKSKGLIVDEATTPNLAPNRIIVVEDNADKEPGRGAALP